jgi:myosin regulatory light chain 12
MSAYSNDYLSPNTTPSKLGKGQRSRARREPSGVFSLFKAPQIQQFKEAFQLIDHDKDGWVNEQDLREIFASLGELHWVHKRVHGLLTGQRYYAVETDDG